VTIAAADISLLIADCLLKATVLLLLAFSACFALRRSSAARRHLILLCAFGAVLLTPLALLTPTGPSYALPPLTLSRLRPAPGAATAAVALTMPESGAAIFLAENHPRPLPWAAMVAVLYAAGLVVSLTPLIAGLLSVRRLGARAGMTDETLADELVIACRRMGVRRRVTLKLSDRVAVPMTWGWRRPDILLPTEAAGWPSERRQAAVLHEAAHIARGDWAAQMLVRLLCSLYWFHPLIWLAAARLRVEAERASDDRVLTAGIAAPEYARHLLGIACTLRSRRGFGQPAALTMAHAHGIEGRLRAILDAGLDRRPLGRRTTWSLLLAATVLLLPFAALRPTIAQPPAVNPIQEQRYAEIEARLSALEREIGMLKSQPTPDRRQIGEMEMRLRAARETMAAKRMKESRLEGQNQNLNYGALIQALVQRVSELGTEKAYLLVTLRDTAIRAEAARKRLSTVKNAAAIRALQQELTELEIARETQTVRLERLELQLQHEQLELALRQKARNSRVRLEQ
jgi:beta-lactamase regulating signal transducer with metallopeptidase domain